MSAAIKTRFSDAEDVIILREVNAKLPFMSKRGTVMQAWNAVAEAVSLDESFNRPGFDGKRAQNRFTLLMEAHKTHNTASAQASGVDEEYDEKTMLLDELTAAYDDWKSEDKARLDEAQRQAEHIESLGATVREEAMKSLGKRKASSQEVDPGNSTSGGGNIIKMMKILHDDSAADLEFRKYQYEKDLEEREKIRTMEFEERKRERELFIEQMRMQHEVLVKLLSSKNEAKE
ncbi:hypothetical protein AC1031_016199 [Aphanomyces cochlioides]|nr:hypothetical protein AC1031_016199 [Aphanomyces cochlioides]